MSRAYLCSLAGFQVTTIGRFWVTAEDTALRFGHWFGVDPQFWLNLQAHFDLVSADKETGDTIRLLPTKEKLRPQTEQPIAP